MLHRTGDDSQAGSGLSSRSVSAFRLSTAAPIGAQGMEREAVKQQAESLLEQVGLTADAATRTGRFSGGMRRRLSVAVALLGASEMRGQVKGQGKGQGRGRGSVSGLRLAVTRARYVEAN